MISVILAAAILSAEPTPVAGGATPDASAQVAAAPQTAAKPADTKIATAKDDKDSRVCRYEIPSGARIAKKVCR